MMNSRGALTLAVAGLLAFASVLYAQSGAWEYRHDAPAVSLMLPSSDWHKAGKAVDLADFWTRALGIAILAGLTEVQALTPEEHAGALAGWRAVVQGDARIDGKPAFEDGTTRGGDPYTIATYTIKNAQPVWGAQARIRLRAAGLTVGLRFEGHPSGATAAQRASASRTFSSAVRSIAASVKFVGSGATVARSGATPAVPSALGSVAPPAGSAAPSSATSLNSSSFLFDWGLPCQVPVTEVSQKQGKKLRLRYTIAAKAMPANTVEIQLSHFTLLTFDGIDITSPEWRERLKALTEATSVIPALEVSPRGDFLKTEKFDRMVDRMLSAGAMEEEVARKMLATPMIQDMLEQAVGEYWRGWVENWIAWPLRPGEERDAQVTMTPAPGVRFPATMHRRFVEFRDDYAKLEQSGIIEGAAVARAVEPLMKTLAEQLGGAAPSGGIVKGGRIEHKYSVEIRPNGLRPRRTRFEKQQSMKFADGKTLSRVEVHELEWDWAHAQGCKGK
jgi:hypothetical protein